MIALDDNGNFAVDADGHLTTTDNPPVQSAKSECRCIQGSWTADPAFGRNQIIWTISQSVQDRSLDINRVVSKYTAVMQVQYDTTTQTYNVQVA